LIAGGQIIRFQAAMMNSEFKIQDSKFEIQPQVEF